MPRVRYDARTAWDVVFVAMGMGTVVSLGGMAGANAATETEIVDSTLHSRQVTNGRQTQSSVEAAHYLCSLFSLRLGRRRLHWISDSPRVGNAN